jgi:glycosyltransferase involved in cell wall biosynthesis
MSAHCSLLIVSYHFAPSPAVGAKRFSFLAREFARLGYEVHVVTNEMRESPHGAADVSLPMDGRIHRVAEPIELPLAGGGFARRAVNALARRVLAPVGWEYAWARAATASALAIARELPRGVVIATSPPQAALIAGARIARALRWPLILDYRDPWSGYDWPRWRRGRVAQEFARRIETRLVRQSAVRVLNTPSMRESFEKYFPLATSAQNYVIPNGFDAPQSLVDNQPPAATGAVDIVHAGEIFTGRSLVPVLTAVRKLRARFPDRDIRVTTYGNLPAPELARIRDAGLADLVRILPRIPLAELAAVLKRAHVLLAVVGDHMLYSAPYKVYDYMAAGRPILGLAPHGAALYELLADSGAGVGVEPADVAGIEHALEKMIFGRASDSARARIERFRWSNLALQYRLAIESALATSGATTGGAAVHGRSARGNATASNS